MASRSNTQKKGSYSDFLKEKGLWRDGIVVIGFRFADDLAAVRFHYGLMAKAVKCALYDRVGDKTVVCIGQEYAEKVRFLGGMYGGDEFSVDIML